MSEFKPDIELAERMCLIFVRYIRGRPLVKRDKVPEGWIPPIDDREAFTRRSVGRRKASDVTYPKRDGLSAFIYDYLLSMLADEAFIRRTLTVAGIDAIDREDTGEDFRMSRYRERFLRRSYKLIARKFRNGRATKWAKVA